MNVNGCCPAVSWWLVLGVRRLSPKGIWDRLQTRISDYRWILVLALPSWSLNHSLFFLLFPQPQSNCCSHGSCAEGSLQWQEGSLICSPAPALYVPKLPVLYDVKWIYMIVYFRWDPGRMILSLACGYEWHVGINMRWIVKDTWKGA